jgi:cytochrome c553
MRKYLGVALLALLPAVGFAADQPAHPEWAFPKGDPNAAVPPRPGADGALVTVPGSKVSFTRAQLDQGGAFYDWFPEDHPVAPEVVAHGRVGSEVRACGICHTPIGEGHPESANLAGLSKDYMLEQLALFKDGRREGGIMNRIAKDLTDSDAQAAVAYFSSLKPIRWPKVVETDVAPKDYFQRGGMRLRAPGDEMVPLTDRIVEIPDDNALTQLRDSRSNFTAYVPKGSIEKGATLVLTGGGGKITACTVCHGGTLQGLGYVPRIAGRSPVYIAHQIYEIRDGKRKGPMVDLMKPVVANLSDDDILDISAYVASLNP